MMSLDNPRSYYNPQPRDWAPTQELPALARTTTPAPTV